MGHSPDTEAPGAGSKSRQVYAELRERILSNEIEAGSRLVIRDIANTYRTSDLPAREALVRLEHEGLVEMTPYRGARVTAPTEREVRETYFIRGHLESIATGLAAERIDGAVLGQIEEINALMREAAADRNAPEFARLNADFHEAIIAQCGNKMLHELTMDIWIRHSGFDRVFRMNPARMMVSQEEHEGIVSALGSKDGPLAAQLALEHKLSIGRSVSETLDFG